MKHREEREFAIHLHLTAEFPEDYEGEQDGFAWHKRFQERVRPALLRAVVDVLRAESGAEVVAAPRGRNPEDAVEFNVSFSQKR
ncbi:MAG: hypothetical protein H6718_02290 [Polyangiaceae bacterium]|nr:hypothetical protein [Polyangiaceae bacterium]MCB9608645.1 hypothetical protein [Polyangiaceae bacterium]